MSEHNRRNPISDTENGFEIDWETIEENVKRHNRRKRHRRKTHADYTVIVDSEETTAPLNHDGPQKTMLKNTVSKEHSDDKKRRKKKITVKKVLMFILIFLLFLIIGLIITFFVLKNIGKSELLDYSKVNIDTIDTAESSDQGLTVSYKGNKYEFNKSVTSILFMGIDKEELDLVNNAVGTAGQADAIYLLAYNVDTGKSKLLSFSRDSMVDINTYATNGDYAGTINAQLCLAYAYGDAHELSAQNVVTSLRRLIFNIPINTYVAMDLNGIAVLNDDIGGVTVKSLITTGEFVEGEDITLKGDQAQFYVRTREIEKLDSNNSRMQRQLQYINSFTSSIVPAIKKDFTLPVSLFNDVTPYITTNLNTARVSYLASSFASDYSGLENITIPGEVVEGPDGKAEFITDREKLYEILLDTYYTKIKK